MSVTPATKGPPPLPSKGPPLPPRNGSLPPLPPSERRVSATATTPRRELPPPPRRNASLPSDDGFSDLEARFRFHPVSSLPPPEPFSEGKRTYPSEMPKFSSRRPGDRDSVPPPPSLPPPPPPR